MADKTTYDGVISAVSNHNFGQQTYYGYTAATQTVLGTAGAAGTSCRNTAATKVLPTPLPGSITKYRPLYVAASSGNLGPVQASYLVTKAVNLGSFDVSGASGTFTDGSAMPTRTELNTASAQTYGPIMLEVTTVLGGTQGTITITFTDDAGNTGQTATFTPTNSASVGSSYILWLTGKQGARDITAVSRSGGTTPTGVIKMWGLLPLGMFTTNVVSMNMGYNFLTQGFNFPELGAGDQIKFTCLNSVTTILSEIGQMWFMGET